MIRIMSYSKNYSIDFEDEPNECPICHRHIVPEPIYAFENPNGTWELLFRCNNNKCKHIFIATYNDADIIVQLSPLKPKPIQINDEIKSISPSFYKIFVQANESECLFLDEIAGVGYRKALEFLIKDYCIKNNPDKKEDIIKKPLAKVIDTFMNDAPKVKSCATKAVWLGNDETHYERKWEDKDIKDLKILIQLTIHHIESELLTEKFEMEMKK
ncbi:DUF4145 domain-containing protein [Aliarcobacter cryaerophilus]|uniref:DUF4145 domain-containing protein n=1 Tax=Aliarcobacter cryaerophilus TaxID=28198 RepID=UPI0021B15F84|nr:DUF4145 domain-containing protein [Aliarcobacter cryaerophilus]MCT7501399.1 DUF4145 domain-containing protein [Aliarcobacter cryaerophilus]